MKSKMMKKVSRQTSKQALALLMGVPLLAGILPLKSEAAGPVLESVPLVSARSKMGSKETSISRRAWVDGMPDLDQYRREGTYLGRSVSRLPGDGAAFCGPISAANVLGWISNTGYELSGESFSIDAAPRASEWRPPASSDSDLTKRRYVSVYNAQTDFLASLATEMGTSILPTSLGGARFGTDPYSAATVLDMKLPSSFDVKVFADQGCLLDRDESGRLVDWDLGAMTIYNHLSRGSLVLLGTQNYEEGVDPLGEKRWYSKNEGHVEVVTRVTIPKDSSRSATLYTRDSAEIEIVTTGEMGITQSQFKDSIYELSQNEEFVQYAGEYACSSIGKKATVIPFTSDPRKAKIITYITVISPPPGANFIGFTPTEVVSDMESY